MTPQARSGPVDQPIAATALLDRSFTGFYRDERDRVVRALALTVGDTALAAEATDEAMTRAYQRWARIGRYDNPGGWVYRVALNWATSSVHRRRRHDERLRNLGPPSAVGSPPEPEPEVQAALEALSTHQRAVVVCRFYLGMSEAETADALGTPAGTVKSRLHRALRTLRARLDHLRHEEP